MTWPLDAWQINGLTKREILSGDRFHHDVIKHVKEEEVISIISYIIIYRPKCSIAMSILCHFNESWNQEWKSGHSGTVNVRESKQRHLLHRLFCKSHLKIGNVKLQQEFVEISVAWSRLNSRWLTTDINTNPSQTWLDQRTNPRSLIPLCLLYVDGSLHASRFSFLLQRAS